MGKALMVMLILGLASRPAWPGFDPTAPPVVTQTTQNPSGKLGLAWVRINGRDSIAWYGGAPIKLGDAVAGGRVVVIAEDYIVIAGREGRRTVPLLDPRVQHRPEARSPSVSHP
ncbi:MAG: hypothetical protein ACLPXB_06275 [Thiobacillaceae bacterium]